MSEQHQQQGSHRASEDEPVGGYGDQGEAEALTDGAPSGEDASAGADETSDDTASSQEGPAAL